jgi:hypothetical protein
MACAVRSELSSMPPPGPMPAAVRCVAFVAALFAREVALVAALLAVEVCACNRAFASGDTCAIWSLAAMMLRSMPNCH